MGGPLFLLLAFIAVVIVMAVAIGLFFASRSRKQDEQRVEAAGIRSDAGELAATMTGQAAFAEQSEERAGVVRAEADEKAREAAALESEASSHREQADATRLDYEAKLRRADEIDPDVEHSSLPAVEEVPSSRAERRAAREEAEAGQDSTTGADFRDDVDEDVYDRSDRGTEGDMSQTQQSDSDAKTAARDPEGEHGTTDAGAPEDGMAIIADPDEFAATEPVMASEQSDPVERTDLPPREDEDADADGSVEEETEAQTETQAEALTEDQGSGQDAGQVNPDDSVTGHEESEQPGEERPDRAPAKEWGSDEGELLEENQERGDRLAKDRADLEAHEQEVSAGSEGGAPEGGDSATSATPADEAGSHDGDPAEEPDGRRISSFTELRDGGFGVGSAAPFEDRAQPLDHPVQAYRDTMTFRAPGDSGYDSTEPDVWFYDEGAAERSGFTRSEG